MSTSALHQVRSWPFQYNKQMRCRTGRVGAQEPEWEFDSWEQRRKRKGNWNEERGGGVEGVE